MIRKSKNLKSSKLKQYKITNKLIAQWFGYANQASFNSSSAKLSMLNGVNDLIYHIEYQLSRE